jgi:nucleoside-diphosphate-sugar epimerase
MKVLVAGASGALGVPLARQLIANGHKVPGLTRDRAGARRLEALGAEPLVADALDRDGLVRAVDGLWADAVIHELTGLHKPPTRHAGMAPTDRLRTEGTTNLPAAAEALGAKRFLTQSIILGYGYRDHGPALLTEDAPFGRPAGDRSDPHLAAMLSTERQAFTAPEGGRRPPRRLAGGLPHHGPGPRHPTAPPDPALAVPAGRPLRGLVRRRHLDACRQRQGQDRDRLAADVPHLPRRHPVHGRRRPLLSAPASAGGVGSAGP